VHYTASPSQTQTLVGPRPGRPPALSTMRLVALSLVGAAAARAPLQGLPSAPLFFNNSVDHFRAPSPLFAQRYYQNLSSFVGPGSPILCIMGGEGAIEPSTGIFYPSIVVLAARLGAAVIEPEHRFFGASLPAAPYDTARLELLTAEQALADAAALISAKRAELRCSGERGEPRCPVVAIGGSYPGWLAAMMRVRYPAVVDMAYAGSAPMLFYAQAVDQFAYYRVVTESAERAVPGCPAAVRRVLAATLAAAGKDEMAARLGLCAPLPAYLAAGDAALLRDELAMVFQYSFANLNMANYPPGPATGLARACAALVGAGAGGEWPALAAFFRAYAPPAGAPGACYDLAGQLPAGANATISSGDWSGVGAGQDGASWE